MTPGEGTPRPAGWAGRSATVETFSRALIEGLYRRGLLAEAPTEKSTSRLTAAVADAFGSEDLGSLHHALTAAAARIPAQVLPAATVVADLERRYVAFVKAARTARNEGDYARWNGHAEAYRAVAEHFRDVGGMPAVAMASAAWQRANGLGS